MREPTAGPISTSERIVALDVLRGLALLGIVMVNVFSFGLPLGEAFLPPPDGAAPAETAGYFVMRSFFQLKWMPIFSMLFGAGLAVQVMRAAARGDDFVPRYLRRVGMLLLIGLAHALLLWYGDILVWYAVLGVGLLFVRNVAPARLLRAGAVLVVVGGVIGGGCLSLSMAGQHLAPSEADPVPVTVADADADADAATGEDVGEGEDEGEDEGAGDEGRAAEDSTVGQVGEDGGAAEPDPDPRGLDAIMAAQFDPNRDVWRQAELVAYRDGPWADAAWFRVVSWGFSLLFIPFGWGFIVFGCFMIGAGLLRSGFFEPDRARDQARVARLLLAIGVPLEVAGGILASTGGFAAGVVVELIHGVSGPVMAVGLLAGITWLVSTGRTRAWDGPVRAAGRAALSVYLGQTIIGLAIFQWWGLGLFGDVPRPQLLLIAFLTWLALAMLATAWLRIFRFGPAEWAWRSLTYGRLQPFLRRRG